MLTPRQGWLGRAVPALHHSVLQPARCHSPAPCPARQQSHALGCSQSLKCKGDSKKSWGKEKKNGDAKQELSPADELTYKCLGVERVGTERPGLGQCSLQQMGSNPHQQMQTGKIWESGQGKSCCLCREAAQSASASGRMDPDPGAASESHTQHPRAPRAHQSFLLLLQESLASLQAAQNDQIHGAGAKQQKGAQAGKPNPKDSMAGEQGGAQS